MDIHIKKAVDSFWWKTVKKGHVVRLLEVSKHGSNSYVDTIATALEDPQDFVNTMYREIRCNFLSSDGQIIQVGTRSNPYAVEILFSDKS